MSQRIVLIAGAIVVTALVAFSAFRQTHTPAPQPAQSTATEVPPITQTPADTGAQAAPTASMPAMASPRAAASAFAEREPTKDEMVGVPRTKPEEVLQGYE